MCLLKNIYFLYFKIIFYIYYIILLYYYINNLLTIYCILFKHIESLIEKKMKKF